MYINGVNYEFRWNAWNAQHIAEHDIGTQEAEFVINQARRPWPEKIGGGKWRVWGQTERGRHVQVIYIVDPTPLIFVIHARELTYSEKRTFRRRRR